MSSVPKRFVSAQELANKSRQLAEQVVRSGIKPTWVIALWRGGATVGIYLHEYLEYRGIHAQHFPVKTQSYTDIEKRGEVKVFGLDYVKENIKPNDVVLIVDDIMDTGHTLQKVVSLLEDPTLDFHHIKGTKGRHSFYIFTAMVFYKPKRNQTSMEPDFYCESTDQWIVFDHELMGLAEHEIESYKPEVIGVKMSICDEFLV